MSRMRATAAEQQTFGGPSRRVGDVATDVVESYVWGDVENYNGGQEIFDPNAVVLRVLHLTEVDGAVGAYVSTFDAKTGVLGTSYFIPQFGKAAPEDVPQTPWAEASEELG